MVLYLARKKSGLTLRRIGESVSGRSKSGVARDTAAAKAHFSGVRWQAQRDTALQRMKTAPKLKKKLKFRCGCHRHSRHSA